MDSRKKYNDPLQNSDSWVRNVQGFGADRSHFLDHPGQYVRAAACHSPSFKETQLCQTGRHESTNNTDPENLSPELYHFAFSTIPLIDCMDVRLRCCFYGL